MGGSSPEGGATGSWPAGPTHDEWEAIGARPVGGGTTAVVGSLLGFQSGLSAATVHIIVTGCSGPSIIPVTWLLCI